MKNRLRLALQKKGRLSEESFLPKDLSFNLMDGDYLLNSQPFYFEQGVKIVPDRKDRKDVKDYYRNRQNGRRGMAIPMTKLKEAHQDFEYAHTMKMSKELKEDKFTNQDKLWLLDPDNQDF